MTDAEPEIVEEIRAANQRFYDAFNTLDIERMADVWETSAAPSACIPAGRPSWAGRPSARAGSASSTTPT